MARLGLAAALLMAALAAAAVPFRASQNCNEKCTCNAENTEAICTSLAIPKFSGEGDVLTLKIERPAERLRLDDDVFHRLGLGNVNVIAINNATIETLARGAFRNLKNLAALSITNSRVPDVDPGTIAELRGLKTLSLRGSALKRFSHVKSRSLEELTLSDCALNGCEPRGELRASAFDNFPELTLLDLANNAIGTVGPAAFANLKALAEIHLDGNGIGALPRDLFANNPDLTFVDLSRNPLRRFEVDLGKSYVERLDLRSCLLEEIGDRLRNLSVLTSLDLSDNKIAGVGVSSFDTLADLRYLNLSHNRIGKLPGDVFRFNQNLKKIILDGNPLRVLPQFASASGSFQTYMLSCQGCKLETLHALTFAKMPAIVKLQLSDNAIAAINAEVFQKLPNLIDLDLSRNRISALEAGAFAKNSALERVNLAHNPLAAIDPQQFAANRYLKKLDVSDCGLTRLWSDSKRTVPSLEILYAADNKIAALTPEDLEVTPHLLSFDLKNNPLECTLDLRNAIMWLTKSEVKPPRYGDYKTHEALLKADADADSFEFAADRLDVWESLANQSCLDYYEDYEYGDDADDDIIGDDSYDESDEKILPAARTSTESASAAAADDDDDDDDGDDDDNILPFDGDDLEVRLSESGYVEREYVKYSYLWPAFIFIFTALAVLVIAANVILLVLKRRGALDLPRGNLPQIKIIPWTITSKMKKHSGSVYRPLSEDMSGPRTPMLNRYEQLPKSPPAGDSAP